MAFAQNYILAVDQGTTSSKAIVFNAGGDMVGEGRRTFELSYPEIPNCSGTVEFDADLMAKRTELAMNEALVQSDLVWGEVKGIGITNQRETTVLWDLRTGIPVYNAIVWQDRRTLPFCSALENTPQGAVIREKTGCSIDPYFSASKIRWILDNVPLAKEILVEGRLAFGTVDTYLIYRLSGKKLFVTDPSNASRTLLYNIRTLEWDPELIEIFGVQGVRLPTVLPTISDRPIGMSKYSVPIYNSFGDQQSALYAHSRAGNQKGVAKVTIGTGIFALMHTGREIRTHERLLTTVGWTNVDRAAITRDAKAGIVTHVIDYDFVDWNMNMEVLVPKKEYWVTEYALEGSCFVGCAAYEWIANNLGIARSGPELSSLAETCPDSNGVIIVPAFQGLMRLEGGSKARGTIHGLSLSTTKGQLARAAIEANAFQVSDLMRIMNDKQNADVDDDCKVFMTVKCDGGGANSNLMMQRIADFSQARSVRCASTEATCVGVAAGTAAMLGDLSSWDWDDILADDSSFTPAVDPKEAHKLLQKWDLATERSLEWAE